MKFGLFGIHDGPCARPETAARVARAAEDAGFDSLWARGHVVLADPQVPPSPSPPRERFLDPAVSLAFLATHTERGRLVFGLGAGYLKPEFDALGIPFDEWEERTDEYPDAILAFWTLEKPAFEGATVRFSGIDAQPRPVERPHPPIVVGGLSKAALCRRRARDRARCRPATRVARSEALVKLDPGATGLG